jgi:hypothetical protein
MDYYPARDGYPSMFEPEDAPDAAAATSLHRSYVDRLFADRSLAPGSRGRFLARNDASIRRASKSQRDRSEITNVTQFSPAEILR